MFSSPSYFIFAFRKPNSTVSSATKQAKNSPILATQTLPFVQSKRRYSSPVDSPIWEFLARSSNTDHVPAINAPIEDLRTSSYLPQEMTQHKGPTNYSQATLCLTCFP